MSVEVAPREGVAETPELTKRLERAKAWVDNPDPAARLAWRRWLSKVLEEILVTDALSLYPLHDRAGRYVDPSGNPYGLRQLDGATIVPLVDNLGSPPLPPATAFYQVIHGLVETHFELGRLWYLPRNVTPDSPYGKSPTEWVLITVNIALRSQLYDLAYYTAGTIPEGLFSISGNWSQDQLARFQDNFDAMLEGRDEARHKVRFVPPGEWHSTKSREWNYEFQEWLARVIAWAFGVSPMPIAKIMNRATAEMQEVSAIESGVRPLAEFVEDVLNDYLAGPLESPDLEAHFGADETEDPEVVKDRNVAYLGRGVRTINSVRREVGEEEVDPEIGDQPIWDSAAGPVFLEDLLEERKARRAAREAAARAGETVPQPGETVPQPGETNGPADDPKPAQDDTDPDDDETPQRELARWASFTLKRARTGAPLRRFQTSALPGRDRARVALQLRRLYRPDLGVIADTAKLRAAFDLSKDFQEIPPASLEGPAAAVRRLVERWLEDNRQTLIDNALEELPPETLTEKLTRMFSGRVRKKLADVDLSMGDLLDELIAALERAGKAGADDTIAIGGLEGAFDTVPEQAAAFARQRAGELVVDIPQTLMRDIRAKVTTAISEGWSPDRLAGELESSTIGKARAERIARTETGMAYNEGAADVYEAGGQQYVEILDGPGCTPDGHDDTAGKPEALVGVVQTERLANGQVWTVSQLRQHLLGHPNCVRGSIPYERGL